MGLALLHRTKRDFDSAVGGRDWPVFQVRPLSWLMPGVLLRIQRQWKSTEKPKQLTIRSHNLKLAVVGATVDEPSCKSSHQSGLARSSSLAIPARYGSVISINRPHWTGNIHVLNPPLLFKIQIRARSSFKSTLHITLYYPLQPRCGGESP